MNRPSVKELQEYISAFSKIELEHYSIDDLKENLTLFYTGQCMALKIMNRYGDDFKEDFSTKQIEKGKKVLEETLEEVGILTVKFGVSNKLDEMGILHRTDINGDIIK